MAAIPRSLVRRGGAATGLVAALLAGLVALALVALTDLALDGRAWLAVVAAAALVGLAVGFVAARE